MYRVAISAGHHVDAQGADRKGITEFSETVPWQQQLIETTEEVCKKRRQDVEVIEIETGKLGKKVRQINQAECDLAIEIHFNAASDDSATGCEILYCPGSDAGAVAGRSMQLQLASAMGTKSRGVKPGWYRMDRPGVVDFYGDKDGDEMPDYFLRATNCVALIIEPEFLFWIERIKERREAGCFVIAKAIATLAAAKKGEEDNAGRDTSEVPDTDDQPSP
jgi:hypothetical protein